MKHASLTLAALATSTALAAPAAAQEFELVYGSWLSANNDTNEYALKPYFDMISEATGGSVAWELVPGAQLAEPAGTAEAVGSGLMDAGLVMAPYTPRLLPATNLVFSQSLTGDDYLASVGAMNETIMLDCPQCQEEYRENGAVGFAGYGTSPYLFMCRGDVATLEDLQGLKVRASGGGVSITEIVGATPVSMPPSDATSALERGTIDCVLGAVAWLTSYGYMDVVDSVIQAPMGMGGPPIMMYTNADVWDAMSPEQRAAHIDHAPDLVELTTFDAQIAVDERTIAEARERGITFHEGGEEFAAAMEEHDARQYDVNAQNAAAAGVEDPQGILDAYLENYEKWQGLIEEQGSDRETFRQLLVDEVYYQVDPGAL